MRRMIDTKQESWITPTLINGWVNISNEPTRYYKDTLGTVWIELSVRSGSGAIFNLPSSYRPTKGLYWVGNNESTPAVGSIGLIGAVSVVGTATTIRALISFRSV